ncbi:hypothetical protein [Polaromonas jejuensis]|uniref:Spore coat protein U domain-containing protein n=1 Tax=Polaromonas jejuensis TaxID=457502 RepID=A0ABW0Q7A7_9BURK|nr:hypothetical protein [Polaromonas jejuensis]
MKKLLTLLALALISVATLPVQAATATGNFDVTVNLTPKCEITTTPGNLSVNYTSFQTTDATNSTDFAVRCTNTLGYSMALSSTSGTLVGLDYTLAIRNAGDTANASTGTGAGTTATSYKIKATVAKDQSGTCSTAQTSPTVCTATDSARTLTITY